MSQNISTYSYLPWLRQGIANNIKSPAPDGDVKVRASVSITLTLKGEGLDGAGPEPISKEVALYGPGDIIGIDSKAIVKTDPRNWITNFEPNYLPYIEFYDEDFPWRYTPAAPDTLTGRLQPWILLAVLREDEFKDGKNISVKPLPYIEVADTAHAFPPVGDLWAWAHVHINEDIVKLDHDIESNDLNSVLQGFKDVLAKDPDLAYSRIVCPRKLVANTPYHAFLLPAFETGRLAGLKEEIPPDLSATHPAWGNGQKEFPYYHRWYFRTGTVGDFEYLVGLLEPKPVDNRVGRRNMDVQNPGSGIAGITDEELAGFLKLGGALRIPFTTMEKEDRAEVIKYENWDRLSALHALSNDQLEELLNKESPEKVEQNRPHLFQQDLAAFINLADSYTDSKKTVEKANEDAGVRASDNSGNDVADPDPVISPPLYGRWHAMVQRLLEERNGKPISPRENWVHELNLDPRWRTVAGFGTKIVQEKQEEYMDSAWGQVGDILEANRRIRLAQLAREASRVFYQKHITPLKQTSVEKALQFTGPLLNRVLVQGVTAYHHVKTSRVPYAVLSSPMRRVLRPRSRFMRLLPFNGTVRATNLVDRINTKLVSSAPPRIVAPALTTLDALGKDLSPRSVPGWILNLLSRFPWLQYIPLVFVIVLGVLKFVLALAGISVAAIGSAAAVCVALAALLRKWTNQVRDAESIQEKNQTPESLVRLPRSPDFRITDLHEGFTPRRGATDSLQATRFKAALQDTYGFVQAAGRVGTVPEFKDLDLPSVTDKTIEAINPELTIPKRVMGQIRIPERLLKLIGNEFREAMAYPEFDIPMYKPLVDISSELFLPNLNYVAQNSVSLLETNQKFIESYMVGLNHEFARELLWRAYPTDQRGSYFRQFWDVSSCLDLTESDPEKLREKLRDIPPLHHWLKSSLLGDHDNREAEGDKEEEAVLVIRGELLKKYPTAVIYAHRAEWQKKDDGTIDNTKERILVPLSPDEEEKPPRDKVKTPLYEAKAEPDIYFFGFDLAIKEARGGTGEQPDDKPGWFFVIKERPGEPRFGLDIEPGNAINVWNDLAWEHLGVADNNFISIPSDGSIVLVDPHNDPKLNEKYEQYDEDMHLTWNKNMNAAEIAYILYQVPMLVAYHASEMLPKT